MKIVGYSQVPTATPFVHLGYAAATMSHPLPGLLWSGIVLVITAILSKPVLSIVGKRFIRKKLPEAVQASGLSAHRLHTIEWTLFLLGILVIVSAFVFGERVYAAPAHMTRARMIAWVRYLRSPEPDSDASIVANLPTQEGQYDLGSILGVPGRLAEEYADGWKTPLTLRAVRHEGQLKYTVVSAGADHTFGTEDDIVAGGAE